MVEKCKYCDKDISNLSSTKKGYHVANCDKNPNYKLNIEKRSIIISKNKRLKNPIIKLKLKCLNCDKDFEIDVIESYYKKGKYKKCCCEKCAKIYSSNKCNRKERKKSHCKECGKELTINILSSDDIYCEKCRTIKRNKTKEIIADKIVCKFCGDEICKRPDVCRKFRQKNNIFQKYLGFDISKIGSYKFYDEFDRIVEKIKNDYFEKELSFSEIGKKYNMNFQTINMMFKSLNIESRSFSDAQYVLFKQGKNISQNISLLQSEDEKYNTGSNPVGNTNLPLKHLMDDVLPCKQGKWDRYLLRAQCGL